MKRSSCKLGMVMWVGLLSAACAPSLEAEVAVDAPGLEAMIDSPGMPGENGVPKAAWHYWKGTVATILSKPMLDQETGEYSQAIVDSGILADPGGLEIFKHVKECTLGGVEFKETVLEGMVLGASKWEAEGLEEATIENVLECVVAFVNDMTDGVEILITGPNVGGANDGITYPEFIHGEAVWCAHTRPISGTPPTPGGPPNPSALVDVFVTVYPTSRFVHGCGVDAKDALRQRVCDVPDDCGLTFGGILEKSPQCKEVGPSGQGLYECYGKPCTMTKLKDYKPDWCDPPT
ncbi:hypothetical protein WMF26_19250 [Sorangium sp. So ce185]|uniref:hypothetical protein n=1 Tax=Sorangium sp. So ce185 TaxID=3133287 RepID=UPI003F607412